MWASHFILNVNIYLGCVCVCVSVMSPDLCVSDRGAAGLAGSFRWRYNGMEAVPLSLSATRRWLQENTWFRTSTPCNTNSRSPSPLQPSATESYLSVSIWKSPVCHTTIHCQCLILHVMNSVYRKEDVHYGEVKGIVHPKNTISPFIQLNYSIPLFWKW